MNIHITVGAAYGVLGIPCAAILISSALQKLTHDFRLFEEAVANYRLFPGFLIPCVARSVVALELSAAFALFAMPVWPLLAAGLLAAAGGCFIVAQCSTLWRGLKISCGCHGPEAQLIGWKTLMPPLWLLICGLMGGSLTFLLQLRFSAPLYLSYLLTGLCVYWLQSIARQSANMFRWSQSN